MIQADIPLITRRRGRSLLTDRSGALFGTVRVAVARLLEALRDTH
jgi:hypothetical protein